jgi:hypothetical protein
MNFEVMALVMRKGFGSPTLKQVMTMMAAHVNEIDDTHVWPSADRLAARCEITARTVRRAWTTLSELGVISQVGTKKFRGGEIKVWDIRLKTIRALPDVLESLETRLSKLPDNLSEQDEAGEQNVGNSLTECPQPPDTESATPGQSVRDPLTQSPQNSPIEESNEGSTEPPASVSDAVRKIWNASPKSSRGRSSVELLQGQIKNLLKEFSAERLLAGWENYLADPENRREDFKFVPGVHRWFKDRKFGEWMPQERAHDTDDSAQVRKPWAEELEFSFRMLPQLGEWIGERYEFPIDPRDPAADYPAELYEKYSIERRAA